jgi:hypothetical protein
MTVPKLHDYDDETQIVDDPGEITRIYDHRDEATVPVRREVTRVYDQGLRAPAVSVGARFPIMRAFELGAVTDIIAASLAAGGRWRIGPAHEAESHTAIWLLDLNVPFGKQLAAWWVGGPLSASDTTR